MKQFFRITAAKLLGLIAALALVFGVGLPVVAATTWTVTKTADTNDAICDSDCSLREAIAAAGSGDTIIFDPSLSGGTIMLGGTLTLNKNMTIDGAALAAPIAVDGANAYRVFYVNAGVTATLNGLTIAHGRANFGGGIYNQGNLIVTNSLVSGNSAPGVDHWGGGILNARSSTLTVRGSTFSGNSADDRGGGIYNQGTLTVMDSTFAGNNAGIGGGIYSHIATMTLSNSTFSGNSAFSCGGVYNNYHIMTMSNCTFSENRATGSAIYGGNGGGLCSDGRGAVLLNSTFSGNSAAVAGGGIAYNKTYNFSTLTLVNTIIANSPAGGDCSATGGAIDTNRNNLVEDGSCPSNGVNFKTGDPQLGPLADNGGPTWTFALLPGSPAINAGDNATCAAAPVSGKDQRGKPRNDAQCDIGAFELNNRPPVAEAGGPYIVAEGSSVTLDGAASSDPDPGDTLTYAWDLDGDAIYGETGPDAARGDETGATPTFSAAGLDGPSAWTVALRVTDGGGLTDEDGAEIAIDNIAPVVDAGPDQVVYEDAAVNLAPAIFSDPGVPDTHTAMLDWGDGTVEAGVVDPFVRTVFGSHIYSQPGRYQVLITVTDDDGAAGAEALVVTVVHGFLRYCGFAMRAVDGLNLGQGARAQCSLGSNGRLDLQQMSVVEGNAVSVVGGVTLGEAAVVQGDVFAALNADLQRKARVGGDVVSGANVRLRQAAQVLGDVTAAGIVVLERHTSVGGAINQGVPAPSIPAVTWVMVSPTAGGADVDVAPQQTLNLPPGIYGKLQVKDRATLILSAGVYAFDQILIGRQVALKLDLAGGPIVVDVAGNVNVVNTLVTTIVGGGGPEQVLFRVGRHVNLGAGGVYLGTFLAPQGEITLLADSKLVGALYGRTVWIHKNVRLIGQPAQNLFIDLFVAP